MRPFPRRILPLLIILVMASACCGQEWIANKHAIAELSLELGFDNHCKVGTWVPARVSVTTGDQDFNGRIQLIVPDSDAIPTSISANDDQPIQIKAGSTTQFEVPVKIGKTDANIEVQLVSENGEQQTISLWQTNTKEYQILLSTQQLYLQIGEGTAVETVVKEISSLKDEEAIFVQLSDVSQLPNRWYLLSSINQLIIGTTNVEPILDLTSSQLTALEHWINMGGRLLFSVGNNANQLLQADQPLNRFTPGEFVEVLQQRDTEELEIFSEDGTRLDIAETTLEICLLKNIDGSIIVSEGSSRDPRPLIIRNPFGFGLIDFLAFDLEQEPILTWNGRKPVLKKLLRNRGERKSDAAGIQQQIGKSVAHLGYEDITGQLRLALDQFSGVTLIPFILIGTIIVVYALLIGPGDFFLLNKLLPRMEYTWVTFPLMVIGTCVLIWQIAISAKGTDLKVNQVDLVDIDFNSGLARSSTWAHIYSPETATFDINVENQLEIPVDNWNHLLGWQGVPGSALGGMNSRQAFSINQDAYQFKVSNSNSDISGKHESIEIAKSPIQTWSSRSYFDRGWGTLTIEESTKSSPLTELSPQVIVGTVHNPTSVTFKDCFLFYRDRVRYINHFPAGGSIELTEVFPTQTIERVLRKTRLREASEQAQHWNRQGTDIDRLLEVMSLYEAAGGRSYTSLSNRVQSEIDLSDHINNGRAVLIGKAENSANQLKITSSNNQDEAQTQSWTYYRLVYPVTLEP